MLFRSPPQQGHQQAGGNPLAHHITDHQGPAALLPTATGPLGMHRNEVVVVATDLKGRPTQGRQLHTINHRTVIRKQLGLNPAAGAELAIEQFMAAYMKTGLRGAPKIVRAAGHSFSDVAAKCVHIVNLASLRELERAAGRPVDPLRFRANIYIDGVPAWEEFR